MHPALTRETLQGELPLTDTTVEFVDSLDDVLRFREWLSDSRGRSVLAVDTETTGLDTYDRGFRIRLAQFGTENEAWVINCEKWPGIVREVMETYTDTPMVMHNAEYDYRAMLAVWPDMEFPWHLMHDTMLYMRLHDNETRTAGLKPVAKRLFGPGAVAGQDALEASMALNGWTWATIPMSSPAYTIYSGVDVILTARLWRRLAHIHSGPTKHIAEMEMESLRIMTNMSIKGMKVDRDYCKEKADQLHGYVQQVSSVLETSMGVNPRSSGQLADYFIRSGATLTERTAKGAWSMDKEALSRLAAEGFEVADAVLEMRKADKIASTYFDNLLETSNNPDSLIHPRIETIAARTGRMSVSKPSLQNLPSKDNLVRGAFIPNAEGEVILSCDFSQIELRLTAHLTGDPALIAAFEDCDRTGEDFFTRVGKDIYGPAFVKSDKRRTLIKNVIYGSTYGAGVQTMAASAKVPVSVMQPIADDIFSKFVGVKGIQKMCSREAAANRSRYGRPAITNAIGRLLYVDPEREYAAANYAVQSLAADEMKKAVIRLDHAGLGALMLLPIHDEIVMSVPKEDAAEVAEIVREIMTITPAMGYAVGIPAEPEEPRDRWGSK